MNDTGNDLFVVFFFVAPFAYLIVAYVVELIKDRRPRRVPRKHDDDDESSFPGPNLGPFG